MLPIKERRERVLQDVIDQFSPDPRSTRSVGCKGACKYYPPEYKPKSIGCAIGMYLPWKKAAELDKHTKTGVGNLVDELPKWMKDMNVEFLQNIQTLHDGDDHWLKVGLSVRGMRAVEYICKKWDIPYDNLTFYNTEK